MNPATLKQQQAAMRSRMKPVTPPAEKPIPIPHPPAHSEPIRDNRSKDVVVYVRHISGCKPSKGNNCDCPRWLYDKATYKRFSARTTSQGGAERLMDLRDPVKSRLAELERKRKYESILIEDALQKYIKDCESRGLSSETQEAYGCAVRQLRDFAHKRGVFALGDITPDLLLDWRGVWPDERKASKQKKQRQIKTFFTFACEKMHWLDINANPALALSKINGEEEVSAVPFYEDQYNAILDTTYVYEELKRPRGAALQATRQPRLRALIQLMRWSGLAIRDALTLPRWRIDAQGVLKARRTKTKTWMTVPIPPQVVEELRALRNDNPEYFFWSGTAKPRVLVGDG